MKQLVAGLFLSALVAFGIAIYTDWSGRSGDEQVGSAVFYVLGTGLLAADLAIVLVYGVLALFRRPHGC